LPAWIHQRMYLWAHLGRQTLPLQVIW